MPGDVDRVVADALVEACDDCELHADLQVDPTGRVALEDGLDELTVQIVEVPVHVVQRRSTRLVADQVRLGGLLEQELRLSAHLLDDTT